MATRDSEMPVHITAHRSWWNGRITALCGFSLDGREKRDVYVLWSPGPKCRDCRDIQRGRKPMPASVKRAKKRF